MPNDDKKMDEVEDDTSSDYVEAALQGVKDAIGSPRAAAETLGFGEVVDAVFDKVTGGSKKG